MLNIPKSNTISFGLISSAIVFSAPGIVQYSELGPESKLSTRKYSAHNKNALRKKK